MCSDVFCDDRNVLEGDRSNGYATLHIPNVTELLTLKQLMDLEDVPVSKVKPCKIEDLSSIHRTPCFINK